MVFLGPLNCTDMSADGVRLYHCHQDLRAGTQSGGMGSTQFYLDIVMRDEVGLEDEMCRMGLG